MSRKRKNNMQSVIYLVIIICAVCFTYINRDVEIQKQNNYNDATQIVNQNIDLTSIPEYTSSPYVEINNNVPYFSEDDYTTQSFEKYSEWDELGRTRVAFANVCKETMPAEGEERGSIGSIKNLSGWVQNRYDDKIKDKYLYNRCHLIGWQLSAENANKNNLMTGTRYLNTEGMLPFENIVAEYLKDNIENHVLYRVTPIYDGDNLLASGVEMEAWSIEDNGEGICFNVYCYNVQPGIIIDYSTGENYEE